MNHERQNADRLRSAMLAYHRDAQPIFDAIAKAIQAEMPSVLISQSGQLEVIGTPIPEQYREALDQMWRNCLRAHSLAHLIDGEKKSCKILANGLANCLPIAYLVSQ